MIWGEKISEAKFLNLNMCWLHYEYHLAIELCKKFEFLEQNQNLLVTNENNDNKI